MKIILMTDMEGITNVDSFGMLETNSGEGYERARYELMMDTNAAIAGYYDAGAEVVYVYDGHHKGTNFIPELLDKRAIQLNMTSFHELVTSGEIDGYAEVGLHAMAGAENAFLDHTQSSKTWFDYSIDGVSCGELIQGAAYVGRYGIPFIFASGDDAACDEAKRFIPGVATAVVKHPEGRNKAHSLPEKEARELIYQTARESVKLIGTVKPYVVKTPCAVTVTFQRTDYCDSYADKYERIGSRTVKKQVDEVVDYFSLLI